jgi:hypothetical protein
MLNKASTIDAPVEPRPAANRVRDVIAANFGTFFEWFDLLVSAMFAVVPTYDRIGLLAPDILVAGRMLQGFSAGGDEYDRC